jgi:integrase
MGKRKRGTAKHAGIVLYKRPLPSGAIAWRARLIDPDTKRKKHETLPDVLTTEEQRTAWAVARAQALRSRKVELAVGAPEKTHLELAEVIKRYYTNVGARLRPKTLVAYRDATDALLEWARRRGLRLADDLTAQLLADLRATLANQPLQRQEKKAKKNRAHAATSKVRSPNSVNRELRAIKTVLEQLRVLGLVPMLHTKDSIRDSLKALPTPKPVPEYLKPGELVKLIEAVVRHDKDMFDLTRKEKAAGLEQGETIKHDEILPYFATVLLSGMRSDETCTLRWNAIDLNAPPAGAITLRPEDVKTKHGRIVDLVVSPVLHSLLSKLKLKAGDAKFVFGGKGALSRAKIEAARKRLQRTYGAPDFSWQQLRVTCGTFLANAGGIFGGASAYREARQLGHSVAVAEKHYLGVVHVAREATTIEAAMGIEKLLRAALGITSVSKERRRARRS